jgi:glycolate oxidase iron-sulfur subunit
LRTCVHCGFCTATCPTYLLTGDELDSPRGRIYLIKDMLEGDKPASATVAKHIDRCLSCLSCMTTCPSGVHYMHLVDHARQRIEETFERPIEERRLRGLLAIVLSRPWLFRLALIGARFGKAFKPLLPAKLAAMMDMAPARIPFPASTDRPQVFAAIGKKRGRVAMLSGCAQPVLRPEINAAAIRLLNRLGVEVVVAKGAGCCGALTHHMGKTETSHGFAKKNIAAWRREMSGKGLDAVVITASGCGTTVKDYGFMFREDLSVRDDAEQVSAITCDITEYVESLSEMPAPEAKKLKVAYHSACSMQHGQKITSLPKELLRKAGFDVVDVPEGHICCGSAGTYNLLQPEFATQLKARKAKNIDSTQPDVIATGNIGCLQQLQGATSAPIVHTVELLDWAYGGPVPRELRSKFS